MKKKSVMVMRVLMSILTAGTLAFGFTACSDELNNEVAGEFSPLEISSGCGLENLEQHSYAVPYMVTAQGDWKIDFKWNEGHQICYAHPNKGHGPQQIKICVIDNWTDERRSGEMTITDSENKLHPQVVKLEQKCNLDNNITRGWIDPWNDFCPYGPINPKGHGGSNGNGGSNGKGGFQIPNKGNRIYGVGYGYNMYMPMKRAITLNPIIKVEAMKEENIFVTEGVDMLDVYTEITGSTFSEISNKLRTKAGGDVKCFGFDGEVSAAFGRDDFSQNKNEYSLGIVDVYKTKVELVNVNHTTIALDYMCDEAYASINGMTAAYDSTDAGLYRLVKDYGTHLILRTKVGGQLTIANTVDLSKVEGNYSLSAFAKCSYKNSCANASVEVNDDYKNSFSRNSKAVNTSVTAYGGTQVTASNVSDGKPSSITAWKRTLNDVTSCKVVEIDKETLIPLWDLVNINEDGGERRRDMIKEFIEKKLYGMMQAELQGQSKSYPSGTIAHIGRLPQFPSAPYSSASTTLIHDVFQSGQHVARICHEYLPQINKKQRITVIYPVVENNVKYNMGYYPGDADHKPYHVCCTDDDIIITEIVDEPVGVKNDLYLRGTSFYTEKKDSAVLKSASIAETTREPAYMKGIGRDLNKGEITMRYAMAKIFGRIWLREYYSENADVRCHDRYGWYTKKSNLNFKVNHWRVATYDDDQNLLDGLKNNGITLPATMMFNRWDDTGSNYAEDLTGFAVYWEGWCNIDGKGNYKHNNAENQMEFLTRSADGKEYGHVRIKKAGSVEIVKKDYGDWGMMVRLAMPLSAQK